MKRIIILILFFLIAMGLSAEKLATLEGLMKPESISIGNGRLYILEGVTFHIYDMKTFSLIKKFGKEGEGPKEFKKSPFGPPIIFFPFKDQLLINSMGKLSYFTQDGEYIKERKMSGFRIMHPCGKNFLSSGTGNNADGKMVMTIQLLDQKLEQIKELYQSDMQVGPNARFEYPNSPFGFMAIDDKIYIGAGTEGFVIKVFDLLGKPLYQIKKEQKPIRVDQKYKDKTINWFKTNPAAKQYWEFFKDRLQFKEYYPAFAEFTVDNDLIYMFTYKQQDNRNECIVLDLKGNEITRTYLPYPERYGWDFRYPYNITNNTFYILTENIDDEEWELHSYSIPVTAGTSDK